MSQSGAGDSEPAGAPARPQAGRHWLRSMPSCEIHGTGAIPGTTADLTCAALFVVILEGGWDR